MQACHQYGRIDDVSGICNLTDLEIPLPSSPTTISSTVSTLSSNKKTKLLLYGAHCHRHCGHRRRGQSQSSWRHCFQHYCHFLLLGLSQDQPHLPTMFYAKGRVCLSTISTDSLLFYPTLLCKLPGLYQRSAWCIILGKPGGWQGVVTRRGCCNSTCLHNQGPCLMRIHFLCIMSNVAYNLQE